MCPEPAWSYGVCACCGVRLLAATAIEYRLLISHAAYARGDCSACKGERASCSSNYHGQRERVAGGGELAAVLFRTGYVGVCAGPGAGFSAFAGAFTGVAIALRGSGLVSVR